MITHVFTVVKNAPFSTGRTIAKVRRRRNTGIPRQTMIGCITLFQLEEDLPPSRISGRARNHSSQDSTVVNEEDSPIQDMVFPQASRKTYSIQLLIAHCSCVNPKHLPAPGEMDEGMGGALPPIGIGRSLPRIIYSRSAKATRRITKPT